jgi:hypothetical protein
MAFILSARFYSAHGSDQIVTYQVCVHASFGSGAVSAAGRRRKAIERRGSEPEKGGRILIFPQEYKDSDCF